MNYLVSPILYKGSCFNDIVKGLVERAKDSSVSLTTLYTENGSLESDGLDNPEEYFNNSIAKLKELARILKSGDKVLFVDFFCPGLDLLEYYLTRKNIKIEKIALLHGGSFIDGDLFSDFKWLNHFEKGWIDLYDKIVSPSDFFLRNLEKYEKIKFLTMPWGLDPDITPGFHNKKYDVIFPHRLAKDKGILDFIKIVELLPEVNFCVTGVNKSALDKDNDVSRYIKLLKRFKNVTIIGVEEPDHHIQTLSCSKIVLSTAKQEGFGYAIMKAMQSGNIPLVPNQCCYKEYYAEKYIYKSTREAVDKIRIFLSNYPKEYIYPDTSKYTFNNIINLLK